MKHYDVLVIGAGPAGLSAVIYLSRSAFTSLVLDKSAPGGKLLTIAKIDNYPGIASPSGTDLAMKMVAQAQGLGAQFAYGSVQSVSKDEEGFRVVADNEVYLAKALIVATGSINKKLGLGGESEFLGRGVSYCATCDGNFFKKQDVALYGNGDSALEEALYLAPIVRHLYFLVDGSKLTGSDVYLSALKQCANVEMLLSSKIVSIEGEDHVDLIVAEVGGLEHAYPVHGIFLLAGEKSSADFLAPLALEGEKGYLKTDSSMMTSCPGLFAAGDIVAKPLRQVVTAAGEGAVAATGAIRFLNKKRG